jgi:hypothetical protein
MIMMTKMAESITWNQNQGEVTISEVLCRLRNAATNGPIVHPSGDM